MTTPSSRGDVARDLTVIASLTNGNPWTRPLPNKVPPVSAEFWALCVLSAAAGSLAADLLLDELGIAVGLGTPATTAIVGLVATSVVVWQLALGQCVPGCYWLTVTVVGVLGTLVADYLAHGLGLSRVAASGVVWASIVVGLAGRHLSEHPRAVPEAHTRRDEAWYWFIVLGTCAVGTSVVDLVPGNALLGRAEAGVTLTAVLAAAAFAHHGLGLKSVAPFWMVFVVARATGVAWGDALAGSSGIGGPVPRPSGTLGILVGTILVMVGVLAGGAHRSARRQSGAGQVGLPTVGP